MNLVSYAQNQEDIMLHRALRDVARGFYIDVGAQQPIADSVTKLFYEMGWSGINIDPMPQWCEMLKADRPHDINLQLAVSDRAGSVSFYAIPGTGLSTVDQAFAQRHEMAGYAASEIKVEVRTLDEICAEYRVTEVHFLKIDVEGAEEGVIRGFSFDRVRPWIVVVEAVEPVAQREGDGALDAVPTHEAWEPLLLARNYEFVYWDGLNRFYLAHEHIHLRDRFSAPPNPLDAFVRHNDLVKHERILQLEDERRALLSAADVVAKRRELGDLQGVVDTAANRLCRIAELEQDNARLVGRASALEERVADSVGTMQVLQQSINALQEELAILAGVAISQEAAQARAVNAEARIQQLQADHQLCSEELEKVLNSHSWRVTRPLRWISKKLKGETVPVRTVDKAASGRSVPRRAVRRALFAGARLVRRNESARHLVKKVLERSPALKGRVEAFHRHNARYIYTEGWVGASTQEVPGTACGVPRSVAVVHERLVLAAAAKQKNSSQD